MDAYAPREDMAVNAVAWEHGYVLVPIPAGCTVVTQGCDTDVHMPLEVAYNRMEMAVMHKQLSKRPRRAHYSTKQDIVPRLAAFWASWDNTHGAMPFLRNGLSNRMDGSQGGVGTREAANSAPWR